MRDLAQVEEKILAGLLITATVLVVQGYSNRCEKKDEIELYEKQNTTNYKCWPFPECLDGQEPTVEPGSTHPMGTDISCRNCQQNFYSNKGTNIKCHKCTACGKKLELSPCLSVKDRECADKCISNDYYFNSSDKECHRCTECCEGDNINIESQCIKLTPGTVIGGKGEKHCRRSSKPCNDLPNKNLTSSGRDCNCTVLSNSSLLKGSDTQMNCSLSKNMSLIEKQGAVKSFDSLHITLFSLLGWCITVIVFLGWLALKRRKQSPQSEDSIQLENLVESVPTHSSSAEREPFLTSSNSCQEKLNILPKERKSSLTGSNSCQEKLNVIPKVIKLDDSLPYRVETDLITLLNAKMAPLPNWWDVGRTIGIPESDLYKIKAEEDREGGSPARVLLRYLYTMEKVPSLKELIQVIHSELGRHDICKAIGGFYQSQNTVNTP